MLGMKGFHLLAATLVHPRTDLSRQVSNLHGVKVTYIAAGEAMGLGCQRSPEKKLDHRKPHMHRRKSSRCILSTPLSTLQSHSPTTRIDEGSSHLPSNTCSPAPGRRPPLPGGVRRDPTFRTRRTRRRWTNWVASSPGAKAPTAAAGTAWAPTCRPPRGWRACRDSPCRKWPWA